MENKDRAEVETKKTFFYGSGADGSLIFDGEEPIAVNKGVIAFHSPFFMDEFFGPEPKTQIKIQGFDRATFKLFLDCLLGFKEYSLLDALEIYPISKEYANLEFQAECVDALEPEVMDENVPLVLNLSVFYEENCLTDYVIDFIKTKCGFIDFLGSEKYCGSVDLSAMCKLVESVDFNSVIWTLVYEWGEKYLKDRNKSDVKSFFKENGILEKISLSHFESVAALLDFHEKSKMEFFSNEEVFRLVKKNMLQRPKALPDQSCWTKIDTGYEFKELIVFPHFFPVFKNVVDQHLDIVIRPNPILIESGALESTILEIKARCIFRHILVNQDRFQEPKPIWRYDLHNFYRERPTKDSPEDFTFSTLFSSDEFDVNRTDDGKELVYKSVYKVERVDMEFHAVDITYKFNSPCRILIASLDTYKFNSACRIRIASLDTDTGKYSVYDNFNLYFTKNVDISLVREKGENQEQK